MKEFFQYFKERIAVYTHFFSEAQCMLQGVGNRCAADGKAQQKGRKGSQWEEMAGVAFAASRSVCRAGFDGSAAGQCLGLSFLRFQCRPQVYPLEYEQQRGPVEEAWCLAF